MNPLVSIIIPVYNRESFLKETLNSILKQTYSNWECILVDDGSDDNSKEIAENYASSDSRFISVSRPIGRKKGANSCRNYGFEISKGTYINWFDSDDVMAPEFIKAKLLSFSKNTVDCVISKTIFFKYSIDNVIGKEFRTKLSPLLLEDYITLKISWYISDPMWKKTFLEDKDLYDENLLKGQDRDFHIRILLKSPKILVLNKYLSYYRLHENTISNNYTLPVIRSYYNAINNRIELLQINGISNNLKFFLLKQQTKNYPYLYKDKNSFQEFSQLFYKLFVFNRKNIIWLFKFIIAVIALRLIGKGSVFLKD